MVSRKIIVQTGGIKEIENLWHVLYIITRAKHHKKVQLVKRRSKLELYNNKSNNKRQYKVEKIRNIKVYVKESDDYSASLYYLIS